MTDAHEHWDTIWRDRAVDEVSWFQRSAERSLRLVSQVVDGGAARVVDVGGEPPHWPASWSPQGTT